MKKITFFFILILYFEQTITISSIFIANFTNQVQEMMHPFLFKTQSGFFRTSTVE